MFRALGLMVVACATMGCQSDPSAAGAVPLEWTACPFDLTDLDTVRIRCGYVTVPENRDRDRGRRLRLAFAVIHPSAPGNADAAPILQLSGGPGGTGFLPIFLSNVAPSLAVDRPIVTFDQRGVGYSEPTLCPNRLREDLRLSALSLGGAELRALKKRADLACRDQLVRVGVDLRAYHTRAIADDVEDLRRALGYEQWILMGSSYGGALAQAVMDRHPRTVQAALLIAPARLDDAAWFDIVRAVGGTLRALSESCLAAPPCPRPLSGLDAQFYAVAEGLIHEPMTVEVDSSVFGGPLFTVNPADFVEIMAEVTSRNWELPFAPRVIQAFRDRDSPVVSAAIAQFLGGWDSLSFSPGLQMLVKCHDMAVSDSRQRWQRVLDQFPLEGEFEFLLDICDEVPTGRASRSEREPAVSRIPTLILSGKFDDRSTPAYGAGIMERFRTSRQIVFSNAGHVLPSGSTWECFRQIVDSFVRNPSIFPDGACASGAATLSPSSDLPAWAKKPRG